MVFCGILVHVFISCPFENIISHMLYFPPCISLLANKIQYQDASAEEEAELDEDEEF